MTFITEIRKRKIINTVVFYLGASWAIIEALSFFIERYHWSDAVFTYSVIIIGFGLPSVIINQWFRSGNSQNNKVKTELILHFIIVVGASYIIYNIDPEQNVQLEPERDVIENSIAVLPFQNLGASADTDFYGDGFADDVITTLSKNSNFIVISRTSSFQFRDTNRSIKAIRKQLKVSTILEGSYRVFENQIRLNVNLVQTDSEKNLWSETFTGDLNNIFSLQSQVAEEIAKSLQIELNPISKQSNVDALAYEYYTKGNDLMRQKYISKKTLDESVETLEKAIAIDSTFAKAHITIAEVYLKYLYWGYDEYNNVAIKAREHIGFAGKYNGDIGDIYGVLAGLSYFNYEWKESDNYSALAKEHNPNSAFVYWVDMRNYMRKGNKKKALESLEMSITLDPLTATNLFYRGWILGFFRDFDKSISFFKQSLAMASDDNFTIWGLGYVYNLKGEYELAINTFTSRSVSSRNTNWSLGYALGKVGRTAEAQEVANYLVNKKLNGSFVPAYMIGYVFLGMGDLDNAFSWFEKAYNERLGWISFMLWDPSFDNVRKDERYIDLMKRAGLK